MNRTQCNIIVNIFKFIWMSICCILLLGYTIIILIPLTENALLIILIYLIMVIINAFFMRFGVQKLNLFMR